MAGNEFDIDLDKLGDTISSIIDEAVSSQDYQKLSEAIQDAVRSGSNVARRAVSEAARASGSARRRCGVRYQPNKNIYSSRIHYDNVPDAEQIYPAVPDYYGDTSVLADTGKRMIIAGGAMLFFNGVLPLAFPIWLAGGVYHLVSGFRKRNTAKRFLKYRAVIGSRSVVDLKELAAAVGKNKDFVRKDVKEMIGSGLFIEGHLDDTENNLIITEETFSHYLRLKEQEDTRRRKEAADRKVEDLVRQRDEAVQRQEETMAAIRKQKEEQRAKISDEHQELLDKGNEFVRQIRQCNAAIPGEEISQKISRMEAVVRKIFERAESHPEIVPKLKKLMDYYLPMTVKLLNAYADMDAQPIQGDNISRSKREIEATLDTLNDAFEKLLDSVFQETAMDVSSDISVLQSLLAQEGLTDDGLQTSGL